MFDPHTAYEIAKMQLDERRGEAHHQRLIRPASLSAEELSKNRYFHCGKTPIKREQSRVIWRFIHD
jgi:hypothetical protein